ncbi:MAG TPA: ABC transporter permease [Clostridiaceae bacterium]|nr:ABC transporter permease [Clostridiaceae bacterium]
MNILELLNLAIRLTAPTLLVAIGGIFAAKSGIFNLGLEAFMLIGAFASVAGVYFTESVFLGIIIGMLTGIVFALIFSLFVQKLKVDPIICAIAMLTMSSGLTRYLLIPFFGATGRYILPPQFALKTIDLGKLASIPIIGPILNNHSAIVYISIITPFIAHVLLYKTKFGLELRSVGLHQEAAETFGIHIFRRINVALLLNGMLCGLAGAQLSLSLNLFNVGMTNGRGFTALAAMTLTGSRPIPTLFACLLFGTAEAIVLSLSGKGYPVQILSMLPYVLALIAAITPALIYKIKHQLSARRVKSSLAKH